jgi:hypothetical protein
MGGETVGFDLWVDRLLRGAQAGLPGSGELDSR